MLSWIMHRMCRYALYVVTIFCLSGHHSYFNGAECRVRNLWTTTRGLPELRALLSTSCIQVLSPTFTAHLRRFLFYFIFWFWIHTASAPITAGTHTDGARRCSDGGGNFSCSYIFNLRRYISGDMVQGFKNQNSKHRRYGNKTAKSDPGSMKISNVILSRKTTICHEELEISGSLENKRNTTFWPSRLYALPFENNIKSTFEDLWYQYSKNGIKSKIKFRWRTGKIRYVW